MALTPKQERFVQEYLIDLNASAAYQRAGYKARGNAAEVNAVRLLRNAQVKAAIAAAQAQRAERCQINADRVVQEIAQLALSDIRQLIAWGQHGVTPLESTAVPDAAAAAVQEVSATPHGLKLKLHSKPQALRLLGEHLGLFKERDPLEALLACLPAEFARAVRQAFAESLPSSGNPTSDPAPATDAASGSVGP